MKNLIIIPVFLFFINTLHTQWFPQVSNTTNRLESVSFINSNTGMACGYNGTIIKTTNAGINWYTLNSGTAFELTQIVMLTVNTALVVYVDGNIARTTNGGLSWSVCLASSIEAIAFCNSTTGWAAGTSCLRYKTTNSGETWSLQCSGGTGEGTPGYRFGTKVNDTLVIFVGSRANNHASSSRAVFRIGLNSWSYSIHNQGMFSTIAMGSLTNGYVVGNGFKGVTTNAGYSWESSSWGGSPSIVDFVSPVNAYGVGGLNIYCTTNIGASWDINFTYTQNLFNIQMINESIGVAVGENGTVLRNENLIASVSIISGNIPEKFNLSQNYPNPFNPETNIEFSVTREGNVKILVFDILGKEIAEVLDQNLIAGTYSTKFNAQDLPSGIYVYKLITQGFTESRKMMLIK